MDKYTYTLKTDKILKLVRKKEYSTAAKIADTMDWSQERNVRLLTAAAEAYENTRQYTTAIDVLLRAYENSPFGKRILYKLTELAIAGRQVDNAEAFYKKYLEEAPDENDRYVLRYLIAELKDEPLDRQITILETYKKYEFEEKWAYRLAELYQKAGQIDKCVSLCDEIILWFGVGSYVEQAMALKETYQPLTESQIDRRENKAYYEARVREVANEMERVVESKGSGKSKAPASPEEEADELPDEEAAGMDEELPVIAISDEVAAADLNVAEVVKKVLAEDTKVAAATSKTTSEMAKVGDASWTMEETSSAEKEPMSAEDFVENVKRWRKPVAAPGREAQPEKDIAISEEVPEKTASVGGDWGAIPEEVMQPSAVSGEKEEAPAVREEEDDLEKTKNLKEILRKTVGPEERPDVSSEPTKEIVIPEETQEELAKEDPLPVPAEEPQPAEEDEPQNTLEADANVLPVIPYEETEKAVWEDQNRRLEELEPLESHEMESCIFISSGSVSDGIDKAVEALEEYYHARDKEVGAIAKITSDRLNRRGLVRSLPQLNHKDLIIDQANGLNDKLINEMLEIMEYLDTDKVFVLMDTPAEVGALKQRVRALLIESEKPAEKTLPERSHPQVEDLSLDDDLPKIDLTEVNEVIEEAEEGEASAAKEPEKPAQEKERKPRESAPKISFENMDKEQVLSEQDFIRYADHFAGELECVIDESGFDALKEEIEAIRAEGGSLTAGEAEAIIEDAAEHASKPSLKRLFASKYDKEGYLILRKRNFL